MLRLIMSPARYASGPLLFPVIIERLPPDILKAAFGNIVSTGGVAMPEMGLLFGRAALPPYLATNDSMAPALLQVNVSAARTRPLPRLAGRPRRLAHVRDSLLPLP